MTSLLGESVHDTFECLMTFAFSEVLVLSSEDVFKVKVLLRGCTNILKFLHVLTFNSSAN